MSDLLQPAGALNGPLFQGFLRRLGEDREPRSGDRVGHWRIGSELGRGGSGVVFLAERDDGAFRQQVALKWLRGDRLVPGGPGILARERELLASLDHPHIARLIDGGQSEDHQIWFAMDYVAGQPIDQAAASLGLADCLTLVQSVCQAVHHAHSRGLIHGDIKPGNVLVDERGQPRLLDFGIARLQDAALDGHYGLTFEYASPEQRRGDTLTTASDCWQLGHLLARLLEKRRVPDDLQAIVDVATAESPENRYASAAALADDLDALLGGQAVRARRGGPVYRFRRLIGRHRGVSIVSVLAILGLSGTGAFMTWQLATERDLARYEAERAAAALVESEAALARAQHLRDFLIGLFRAAEPDRPRDQLPSTEELLALGATRALDEDSAPADERLGMLIAIAEVYQTLSQPDQAEPLLRAALELGQDASRGDDLARTMILKGQGALLAGQQDRAERLYREAERVAVADPAAKEAWLLARARRAWLYFMRGEHDAALDLLEPDWQWIDHGDRPVRPGTRLFVLNALASVYLSTGELDRAADLRARLIDQVRRQDGPDSRAHAIQLNNLAAIEMRRGEFDAARASLAQAISLYDRIFDGPVVLRAAALANLANVHLYTGNDEQALHTMRLAAAEWAAAQGRQLNDYEYLYYNLGRMYLVMQRDAEAEAALRHARGLYDAQSAPPAVPVLMTEVWLARSLCRNDQADEGWRLLEPLDPAPVADNPAHLADLHESRAVCLAARDLVMPALGEIRTSLALAEWPGLAVHRAQRQRLESALLEAVEGVP